MKFEINLQVNSTSWKFPREGICLIKQTLKNRERKRL